MTGTGIGSGTGGIGDVPEQAPCLLDAAYVLGALAPADRQAYEEHLRGCADCQASVGRLAGLQGLLALTSAAEVTEPLETPPHEAPPHETPPASILTGLLDTVRRRRRRRTVLLAGVVAAAVAGLAVLVGVLLLRGDAQPPPVAGPTAAQSAPASATPEPVLLAAVNDLPVTAFAELVTKRWGTEITVRCEHEDGVDPSVAYFLVVLDSSGHAEQAAAWRALPGVTTTVQGATAVARDEISALEIRLANGQTILRGAP